MVRYTDVEYLRLSIFKKISYKFLVFLHAIPLWFTGLLKSIKNFFISIGIKIKTEAVDIWDTFRKGDNKTRISYFIMGYGSFARGQWVRGLLFLTMQLVFILYMVFTGSYYLSKMGTLGTVAPKLNKATGVLTSGDNSFKILLYIIITFIFIGAFIWTWRVNVKQNKIAEGILRDGKKLRSGKEDLQSLLDDQFHKSMLALPLAGIFMFTVLPIIFMIFTAFTNYGVNHDPASGQLFTWVGWQNFDLLFSMGSDGNGQAFKAAFGEVLSWTLIWAFFATFLNYILGIFVAMIINKKGIRFKKMWRGILVLTIAVPQFVSLLYIHNSLAQNGFVVATLIKMGIVKPGFNFIDITNPNLARVLVILINVWIGIPYLMLIATGVLMNVPADLYESAKIDGAGTVKQFTKITLPYLLFVTGPYLLTSFTGNLNNFNVIYLLTGGGPGNLKNVSIQLGDSSISSSIGGTDLLITWLYNLTLNSTSQPYYNIAAVISIMIFLVVSILSLVVYNLLPSNRGEEDFQ